MATLTGKTIASTYTSLLKLEGDSGSTVAGGSAAVQVKTGDDDDTPIYLNTDRVGINNAAPGSQLEISKVSGAATLELSSWSATATAAHAGKIIFQKSGTATVNTFTGGDHTTAGEVLGRIEAWGVDDDDGATLSSYIEFANDAVSDADSSPGKITFATSDADDAGTPTARMTIDDGGNVGIGLTDPSYPLEIMGSSGKAVLSLVSDDTDVANGDDLGAIYFMGNDDLQSSRSLGAFIMAEAAGDWGASGSTVDCPTELQFFTQSDGGASTLTDPRMTIASDGNVGIGTPSPTAPFEIARAGGPTMNLLRSPDADSTIADGNSLGQITFSGDDDSTDFTSNTGASILGEASGAWDGGTHDCPTELHFYTQSAGTGVNALASPRMVIRSDGHVGINQTTPSYKLEVNDDVSGFMTIFFNNGNNQNREGIGIQCGNDTFGGQAEGVFIRCRDGNGTAMGGMQCSSNIDLPELFEGSDARIKDGIKDTNINALSILNNLKLREYTKKDRTVKCKIGLVAQETLDVLPELVGKISAVDSQWEEFLDDSLVDEDGNKQMYTIGTGILPYYFIKAIQELSAKVTALENA